MSLRFGVAVVLAMLVAACSGGDEEAAPPRTESRPTPAITTRLVLPARPIPERPLVRLPAVKLTPTRALTLPGEVRAAAAHGASIALLVQDEPGHECGPVVHWDANSGALRLLPTGIRPDNEECRLLLGPVERLALALDKRQVGVFVEYPIPHSISTTEHTLVTVPLDGTKPRLVREVQYGEESGREQLGRISTDDGALAYEVRVAYGPTEHIETIRFSASAPRALPATAGTLVGIERDRLLVRRGKRLSLLRKDGPVIWELDAPAQQTLFDSTTLITLERGSIVIRSAADGAPRRRYRIADASMRPWLVGVAGSLVAYATRGELHLLDVDQGRNRPVRLAGCKPSADVWLALSSGGLFCSRTFESRVDFVSLKRLRAGQLTDTGRVTVFDRLTPTAKRKPRTRPGDVVVELISFGRSHPVPDVTVTLRDVPGGLAVIVLATEERVPDLAEFGLLEFVTADCLWVNNNGIESVATIHVLEPKGRRWETTIPRESLAGLGASSVGFFRPGLTCGDL